MSITTLYAGVAASVLAVSPLAASESTPGHTPTEGATTTLEIGSVIGLELTLCGRCWIGA